MSAIHLIIIGPIATRTPKEFAELCFVPSTGEAVKQVWIWQDRSDRRLLRGLDDARHCWSENKVWGGGGGWVMALSADLSSGERGQNRKNKPFHSNYIIDSFGIRVIFEIPPNFRVVLIVSKRAFAVIKHSSNLWVKSGEFILNSWKHQWVGSCTALPKLLKGFFFQLLSHVPKKITIFVGFKNRLCGFRLHLFFAA